MTNNRWSEVMDNDVPLTESEISEGWHFCAEWDGLLVGPGMGELEPCKCLVHDHPVYKTISPHKDAEPITDLIDPINEKKIPW